MLLLEFAAQGIRGVAPAGGRAALRPGYNVVAADGAALRRLVEALLHPDANDGEAVPRAPGGPGAAAARAGLTFLGADQVTYRVVRDFAAGCQLHRFDPAKRSFAPVSQDAAEIAGLLRAAAGVPPASRLGGLLSIAASELPSRHGGGPPAPAQGAARAPLAPEAAKKRVAELRAELERARAAEKGQARLDAIQHQVYQLDEALKSGQKLRDGLEKAESERRELDALAEVARSLGDVEATLSAYEKASARRQEADARLAAEREKLAEAEARGAPPPLWASKEVWIGAAAGVAALGLGLAGVARGTDLRYVALLDIPAFGWAAWAAHRWVGALEEWERNGRKRRILEDWERRVLGGFERDAALVRAALKAANVSKLEDLRDALARLEDADAVVAEWRRRLEQWEQGPEARTALARKQELEDEARELEARMSEEAGGFVRDAGSVEQELRRIEADAASPRAAAAAPPPAPARPAAGLDPLRAAVERAAAELKASPPAAVRSVQAKASQALSGLSFQRLSSVAADDRGNLAVTVSGRPVPAATLPPADRDLVWLALKLAFLEQGLAAGGQVAVVEDAFAALSDGAKRFAARLLKQIAKGGQLVHGTTDPAFRGAADHAV